MLCKRPLQLFAQLLAILKEGLYVGLTPGATPGEQCTFLQTGLAYIHRHHTSPRIATGKRRELATQDFGINHKMSSMIDWVLAL